MKHFFSKRLFSVTTFFLLVTVSCSAQKDNAAKEADEVIKLKEVARIETALAADEMSGRKTFTPDIDKAAAFIAAEFKAAGLKEGANGSYLQEFVMVRPKLLNVSGKLNGADLDPKNILVITSQPNLVINQSSGYGKTNIKSGVNLQTEARKLARGNKNMLVLVDKSFANGFGNLARLRSSMFKSPTNVVFILDDKDPSTWSVEASHEISEQKLANVVGILPGKSKKEEFVIFSGHYDHLGVGKAVNGDSIYNGANDNAAGTTGVIMLAKYYKKLKDNERTLVFAAFTAEEVGGFGSQYFSRQFEADKVIAMFNLEMIGTESKWGRNSAYITGYEKTDMGSILQKNLEGTGFTFYPDPYPTQQLFYRSDNATFARLGVPAHTISTSKMDSEPNYHKLTDHVETLDLENMTMIIKSIALSARSIVAGKDTPSRVKVEDLR